MAAEGKHEEERGRAMPDQGCSVAASTLSAGLMVLLIESDPDSLIELGSMLNDSKYGVVNCRRATDALSLLKKSGKTFDMVLSSFNMPDMNGCELLKRIGHLEVDIPVIMMSTEYREDIIRDSITHGACDCLLKPIDKEDIEHLWKYVILKQKNNEQSRKMGSTEAVTTQLKQLDHSGPTSSLNIEAYANLKRPTGEEAGVRNKDESLTSMKSRVVWTVDLHEKFVTVVTQLGIDEATPKTILRLMNVPGLTRTNIASHLQKYRLKSRKLRGVSQSQSERTTHLMTVQDASNDLISSRNGGSLQSSVQLSHQSLDIQPPGYERANASSTHEEVTLLCQIPDRHGTGTVDFL